MLVSCYRGAGDWAQFLGEKRKCSSLLNHRCIFKSWFSNVKAAYPKYPLERAEISKPFYDSDVHVTNCHFHPKSKQSLTCPDLREEESQQHTCRCKVYGRVCSQNTALPQPVFSLTSLPGQSLRLRLFLFSGSIKPSLLTSDYWWIEREYILLADKKHLKSYHRLENKIKNLSSYTRRWSITCS